MSKKAVASTIRLVINAGQAKPSPPVGPALGQAGLKIMDFCKDFNAKTADIKARQRRTRSATAHVCQHAPLLWLPAAQPANPPPGPPVQDDVPIPVVLTAYADKTFSYVMKTPPARCGSTAAASSSARCSGGGGGGSGARPPAVSAPGPAPPQLLHQKGCGHQERQWQAGPPVGGRLITQAHL